MAEVLSDRFRILIPDRTGYGQSTPIQAMPADFHSRAAVETARFLDALGIERAILWGHSDGAVIAALLGLSAPARCHALILEAFHLTRNKASSVDFFRRMIEDPNQLGERTREALIRDHGPARWRRALHMNGRRSLRVVEMKGCAWLEIAADHRHRDLYDGRLSQVSVRALFVHGARAPRTEPGELEAVRQQLPRATFHVIGEAGHSPHSEVRAAA